MNSKYRADIDGLRAIAVSSVVLFHTHASLFSGGFVGVDVFFVISGFLITGIIIERGSITKEFFKWFYERRIRRLLPPLIPVLLFSSGMAYRMMPPDSLESYARSLLAFLAFSSNWFFLNISGYFDAPAQTKPLLHTWSLSIEEQFYLLFPLIALFVARFGRLLVVGLFAGITSLSFGFGTWLVWSGKIDSAFYNSFGRFWEIAVGSVLATGVIECPKSNRIKSCVGAIGIAAIFAAVFGFSGETPFPGSAALLPVLGAALIIIANGGLVGDFLSRRPVVGLGLISYALYLWHWPIFVLIGLYEYHPSLSMYVFGILSSLILAFTSFHLVERPFRQKNVLPGQRHVYLMFASVVCGFATIGVAIVSSSGFPDRFPGMAGYNASLKTMLRDFGKGALKNECWVAGTTDLTSPFSRCVKLIPGRENVLIVGDSHAAQFYAALTLVSPAVNFNMLAANSCELKKGGYPACDQLVDWIERVLPNVGYDYVVISVRGMKTAGDVREIRKVAVKIARKTPVVILGPITYYKPYMPATYALAVGTESKGQISSDFDRAVQSVQFDVDAEYKRRSEPNVYYISLLSQLCPHGSHSCTHFDESGFPILIDGSHMSRAASRELILKLSDKFPWSATFKKDR